MKQFGLLEDQVGLCEEQIGLSKKQFRVIVHSTLDKLALRQSSNFQWRNQYLKIAMALKPSQNEMQIIRMKQNFDLR